MTQASKPRADDIRQPRQKRSQDRVDLILKAAKEIIAAKGSAQLKMTEIAQVAGITPSSMYQYFPNKSEIVAALWERQLQAFRVEMESEVDRRPASVTEMAQAFEELVDRYYRMHRDDPVLRDIWMSVSVDKSLGDVGTSDTAHHAHNLVTVSRHLFADHSEEALARKFAMLLEFTTAAVRLAVSLPVAEGDLSMDAAKSLMRGCWLTFDQTQQSPGRTDAP